MIKYIFILSYSEYYNRGYTGDSFDDNWGRLPPGSSLTTPSGAPGHSLDSWRQRSTTPRRIDVIGAGEGERWRDQRFSAVDKRLYKRR